MHSTTTAPHRPGRARRALAWVALLWLGSALGLSAPVAAASAPAGVIAPVGLAAPAGKNLTSVEFDDTADGTGVLNQRKVQAALEAIDFNEPTRVAIYTRDGVSTDNINTLTLKRARAEHPDWISSKDSDKWADGLLIITLSVHARGGGQIGTYFGEDRKIDPDDQSKVQAAGKPSFRQADWSQGVIEVAQSAAEYMNRPWYSSPALWVPLGIGGGVGGIGVAAVSMYRRSTRDRFDAALTAGTTSLTTVTMDLDNTEISAKALPASGSRHAADLETRFRSFIQDYHRLVSEQDQLQGMNKKQRGTTEVRARAELFASQAQGLDETDDTIAAAAALFARTAGWRAAWDLQTDPLREDLAQIPGIIASGRGMHVGMFDSGDRQATLNALAQALEAWLPTAQSRLQELDTSMEAQSITTEDALTQLGVLRQELSSRLQDFANAQLEAFTKSEREREAMREQMDNAQNRPRRRGSILDVTTPGTYWTGIGYSLGYQAGVSKVESARSSASSSGGSTSGYSGGGGSFSGAGSSSSF